MKFIFWLSLIIIMLVYGGYPLILSIISLFRNRQPAPEDFLIKVSVLIPAHNEEKVIAQKLNNVFNLDYPVDKFEVILVLDSCTDGTKRIASSFLDKGLKIIEVEPRRGKIAALDKAVQEAKGEVLIFTDANTTFRKDAIIRLVSHFKNQCIGGVCGRLIYETKKKRGTLEGESFYWKYENFIKRMESRINTLVTANGSIYAIDKRLYPKIDKELADDLVMPIVIASKNRRLIYEPGACAMEKSPQRPEEEFIRRRRIINQGFKTVFKMYKSILKGGPLFVIQFLLHKVLRWLVPIFLISMLISNMFLLNSKLYLLFFIIQLSFYFAAFLSYIFYLNNKRLKALYLIFYFCLLNLAALCGLIHFLMGTQTRTWQKAETAR